MTNVPTNWEDVVDSREIVERVEALTEERDAYIEQQPNGWWPGACPEEARELEQLASVLTQLRTVGGDTPEDGMTLVRESYFQDYAQELADDIGAINHEASWPLTCIDWEQAARELRMDYTSIEWDGVTYYVRY